MVIVMDRQQYQELEDLIGIFEDMYYDNEKVQCFEFLKNIVDCKNDTAMIPEEKKEKMQMQLIESFDFVESLNVKIEYKDNFLSYFCSDNM